MFPSEPLLKAEVNLANIRHNTAALKSLVREGAGFMAAVKGDAYGHGSAVISKTVLKSGADSLGVARIDEAVHLREAGISAPVLIFGYSSPSHVRTLIDYSISTSVSTSGNAELLSAQAVSSGKKIKIHAKVDTGMGRMGYPLIHQSGGNGFSGALDFIKGLLKLKGLELEGLMTHFATADYADKGYAKKQLDLFSDFIAELEDAKIFIPVKHAANSAALIEMPESHFDMVRPGISLYGLYPSMDVDRKKIELRPAMKLVSKIVNIKRVTAGCSVSYGRTFVTDKPSVIATLPVGYGDGYSRLFSTNAEVLVRGKRMPVIGRVCMDLTMIDVSAIPDASIEDEAVLFGSQSGESIHVDELAIKAGTINYEIVTSLTSRVPRIYSE